MKFFRKDANSPLRELTYSAKGHNDELLAGLAKEQRGFCAYTERRFEKHDTRAVEHFDPSLKFTEGDGYENYYAVLQSANQRKRQKEREFKGATFFTSRFFQRPGEFEARITYVRREFVYERIAEVDPEAQAFIDYLGLSRVEITLARRKHIERLQSIFEVANYDVAERIAYFKRNPEELHYITALEAELELDLDSAIPDES